MLGKLFPEGKDLAPLRKQITVLKKTNALQVGRTKINPDEQFDEICEVISPRVGITRKTNGEVGSGERRFRATPIF